MSETRDEVLEDLLSIKGMHLDMVNAVIRHPHIAIVDREAKLPPNPLPNPPDDEGEIISWLGYNEAQRDMLKAGWVKEVKDGPSSK